MEKKSDHQGNDNILKVRIINTQYIVVDAKDFKSVVQNLTGQNSSVEWIDESNFTDALCGSSSEELKKKQEGSLEELADDMMLDLDWNISDDVGPSGNFLLENKESVMDYGYNVLEKNDIINENVELSMEDINQVLEDLPLIEDLDCWEQDLLK
ncbi:hypothetical protein vseg_018676 [Gypsophila vaccaria]